MSDIEELRKKRELLLLEREVRGLERRKRLEDSVNRWSWWWVAPLAAFGMYILVMAIVLLHKFEATELIGPILLAILALAPSIMKIRFRAPG